FKSEPPTAGALEFDVIPHFSFACVRVSTHTQIVEPAGGVIDRERRRALSFELAEDYAAFDLRFVLVAVHELVHVAYDDTSVENARDCSGRRACGRNTISEREIARASRRGSAFAGEVQADHLLVESHANAVRKLRLQK